ncbi:hypothetical protein BJX70DRAFT_385361 [Aspergillus crustosus]
MKRRHSRAEDFMIGWICPLPLEYAAAKAVLDELYEEDEYATGRIQNHGIVIACLPAGQMGTNAAAATTARMLAAFPSLKHGLLVGIAGGVPSEKADIRLGDVVIGQPDGQYGGVVQYDFGKTVPGGLKSNIPTARASVQGGDTCYQCRKDMAVDRVPRADDFQVFFGTIASGNQVIKDGITRDENNSKLGGVLCFEIEATGVVNQLPSLVIRGICDYADSHKNKTFQPFAAATAAACAREILSYLPCTSKRSREAIADSKSQLSTVQRQVYLESLRFEQLDTRYHNIRKAYLKTCKWLLSCPEYKDWLNPESFDRHHGFLWVKGKPGVGKSTLMKFAFVQATQAMANVKVLSFFFNARGDVLERTVLGMYCSLLFQLFEQLPDLQQILDEFPVKLDHAQGPGLEWGMETLKDLFHTVIERLQDRAVVCYIDALDECEEDEIRDMLSFFRQLGGVAVSGHLRLLLCPSSRHYPHIDIENNVELILENQDGHQRDIANYVHSELRVGRSKQVQQIRDTVIDRSSGIFLWSMPMVTFILSKRLNEIPTGLNDLLKDILTRDNHHLEKTLLCLQWILYAKHPLSREQLYFAVLAGTEPSDFLAEWTAESEEANKQNLNIFVLDSSKGLAELTKSKTKPTVQFIHESRYPFLEYALEDVLYHADAAAYHGLTQDEFLSAFPCALRRYSSSADIRYILAEKTCPRLLETALGMSLPVLRATERYKTPLEASIMAGNPKVAVETTKLLLERGATLESRDIRGRTPLSHAVESSQMENQNFLGALIWSQWMIPAKVHSRTLYGAQKMLERYLI